MSLVTVRLSNVVLRNFPRLSTLNRCNLTSAQSIAPVISRHLSSSSPCYSKKEMLEVTFETTDGASYTVEGKEGDNLLDVIVNNNVDLDGFGACEGTLSCSTCHLIFKQEDFDKIEDPCTDEELDMLDLAYGLSDTKTYVSLAGCGFLGVYLIGALECLKRFSPRFMQNAQVFGVSAGSLLAASFVCSVPFDCVRYGFLCTAAESQNWVMGPFSPGFSFEKHLLKGLQSLPHDAHVQASGRLHVSVTRVPDMKNVTISNWDTREDLIQTLRCSCFILGYTGMQPPVINGERYIDGGYTSTNKRSFDGASVSISPFCGDGDICPKEDNELRKMKLTEQGMDISYTNAIRFYRTLVPPPPHVLNEYYRFGFMDAYKYLKKRRSALQSS